MNKLILIAYNSQNLFLMATCCESNKYFIWMQKFFSNSLKYFRCLSDRSEAAEK